VYALARKLVMAIRAGRKVDARRSREAWRRMGMRGRHESARV
jgi:hypothetical protein